MADSYDYRIIDVWDNGEFLTGATVVFLVNDEEVGREKHVGTTEFPPGETGRELAMSDALAWLETMTTSIEERLGPFGIEWEREHEERYEGVPF